MLLLIPLLLSFANAQILFQQRIDDQEDFALTHCTFDVKFRDINRVTQMIRIGSQIWSYLQNQTRYRKVMGTNGKPTKFCFIWTRLQSHWLFQPWWIQGFVWNFWHVWCSAQLPWGELFNASNHQFGAVDFESELKSSPFDLNFPVPSLVLEIWPDLWSSVGDLRHDACILYLRICLRFIVSITI